MDALRIATWLGFANKHEGEEPAHSLGEPVRPIMIPFKLQPECVEASHDPRPKLHILQDHMVRMAERGPLEVYRLTHLLELILNH